MMWSQLTAPRRACAAAGVLAAFTASAWATSPLIWSSYYGGSDGETVQGLVLVDGDVVAVGSTTSDDLPVTTDAHDPVRNPGGAIGRDAFVARLASDGGSLVYATYLGGSGEDFGARAAVTADHRLVVVGQTNSVDFPVTEDAAFTEHSGGYDVFVAIFDLASGALVYATYLGGASNEFCRDVLVDSDGSLLVFGDTASADFPASEADGDGTLDGPTDLFFARLSPAGTLLASRYVGGSGEESGGGIERSGDGTLWLSGSTTSPDLPATPGSIGPAPLGGFDALLLRLSPDFRTVGPLAYLGGSADDRGRDASLSVDGSRVTLYGITSSDDITLTPDAIQAQRRERDLFVASLDAATLTLEASTLFGSAGTDSAYRVATDASGAIVISGETLGGGVPTTPGAADVTGKPGCSPYCFSDAMVARLNASLTRVQHATYLASSSGDAARDLSGTVIASISGSSGGADFPTSPGAFAESANLGQTSSASDAIIAQLDLTSSMPQLVWTDGDLSWPALGSAEGYDVVRGDVATLLSTGGSWQAAVDQCVADSIQETTLAIPGSPASGSAWWFLVRAERTGTPTSWDAISRSQRGTRDDGLAQAPSTCG